MLANPSLSLLYRVCLVPEGEVAGGVEAKWWIAGELEVEDFFDFAVNAFLGGGWRVDGVRLVSLTLDLAY